MGTLLEEAIVNIVERDGGYLSRTPDYLLMAEFGIPWFGKSKCQHVLEHYGTLDNLVKAPLIMVKGVPGLTKPAQETLTNFLSDEHVQKALVRMVESRDLTRSLASKKHLRREPPMQGFKLKPVLEELVGYRLRGRAPMYIWSRFEKGVCLVESIIQRNLYGTCMTDHIHWDLVRAMYPVAKKELAVQLNEYRNAFSGV